MSLIIDLIIINKEKSFKEDALLQSISRCFQLYNKTGNTFIHAFVCIAKISFKKLQKYFSLASECDNSSSQVKLLRVSKKINFIIYGLTFTIQAH